MEEALFRTMLFDSYGELLTEKQREYFDLHYNEERVGHHPPRRGDDAPV